jgi:uncharacterized membrane protein
MAVGITELVHKPNITNHVSIYSSAQQRFRFLATVTHSACHQKGLYSHHACNFYYITIICTNFIGLYDVASYQILHVSVVRELLLIFVNILHLIQLPQQMLLFLQYVTA